MKNELEADIPSNVLAERVPNDLGAASNLSTINKMASDLNSDVYSEINQTSFRENFELLMRNYQTDEHDSRRM
jgi:hypothetical protein